MSTVEKMAKSNIEDILPLTPMQESMLFQYLNNPQTEQYFEQLCLKAHGKIESPLFKRAWEFVAETNEMLRVVYRWDKLEQPVQMILKSVTIPIREYDFTGLDEARGQQPGALERVINEIKEKDRQEKIDIRTAPFRITLLKIADDVYEILISNHHILYDGWSNGIILNEFLEAYHQLAEGHEPVRPSKTKFKDFIKWQREQDKDKQRNYWEEYLRGFDAKTILPFDRKRKADSFNGGEFSLLLTPEQAGKINNYAKQNNIPAATLFYAAWGVLLQKYNNTQDVVFGTTVSGRTHHIKGIDEIVGLFINTLPLRINIAANDSLSALFKSVAQTMDSREDYESASLSEIKLYSETGSNESLFDSIVVIENYPLSQRLQHARAHNSGRIRIEGFSIFERTNFDLTLAVMAFDQIEIKFIYNADRFNGDTIKALSGHLIKILEIIAGARGKDDFRLREIEILSGVEKNELLIDYNKTITNYPKGKTLPEIFEEQAALFPDNPALVLEKNIMSYRELNQKANQLAVYLREKGVKPGIIVGLVLERSFDMLIAIWGVLKAGGAYLPLDHEFPQERIAGIINDANAALLIAHKDLMAKVGDMAGLSAKVLIMEEIMAAVGHYPAENPAPLSKSSDTAYVMYTSGSTGTPKGILTMHYNISRVVKDTNYIEITPEDIVLQLSNYAFDGSTFDIYGALLNGAKLVLAKKETVLDVYRLAELIRDEKVSVFFITTALFNTLVDLEVDSLKGIRKVCFGGERVSVRHVKKALEAMGKDKIIHVYGPTETTVYATYYPVNEIDEDLGTVPIGKPLANTDIYVLDNDMKLLPKGAPGELYIGGDGLANGYLNRPELTRERFVKNPFYNPELGTQNSQLLYKTGDLVRWLPDGNIEFMDRLDNQVKLRGFRIELGEIEAALMTHEMIREAVVLARNDKTGNKYLCAYLVTKEVAREVKVSEIREYLLKMLPGYMAPSRVIFIDEMPLTSNGKVDKRALLQFEGAVEMKADYEAPSTQLEKDLQDIWKEVLGVADIGINDSFFEMGGHSLKATVLASKIHKKLDAVVPLSEILSNPTIKELASFIENSERKVFTPIAPVPVTELYEVSRAQKRMYIQEQFEGIGVSYNMPVALLIEGELDRAKFEDALKAIVNRHEAFRTSFEMVEGRIAQRIHPDIRFHMDYVEAESNDPSQMLNDFIKPFDLKTAPLLRVKLIKIAQAKHILAADMHHIIADGISLVVFVKELADLYEGRKLAELNIHYKDFTVWQEEFYKSEAFGRQENYWQKTLAGELPLLNMPLDYRRPDKKSFRGQSLRFNIPGELVFALQELTRENNITLNALLVSLYTVMLSRYSGQNDLIIGSLVAGRLHPDVESMMGMFNNFLPLRISVDETKPLNEFLKSAGQSILQAYENQDYPYDSLIETLSLQVDQSRNPLFDTMLILHNELESLDSIKFGPLTAKNYELEHYTSKLDFKLDIYSGYASGELQCILEYNVDLFKQATMERMIERYINIIKEITGAYAQGNAAMKLQEVEMILAGERLRILHDFNDTEANYPKDRLIYQLFEEQAEKNPAQIAVIFEKQQLTYGELNIKANQLARRLREKGVKRDSIVGILMERSLEMSIGIMAVLKAGGAYLPISPDYPEERIRYMLQDSGAVVLLTGQSFKERANFAGPVLCLEDGGLYAGEGSNLTMANLPTDLAYIIYTSGSTGKPKGVMIEHYSLVNRLNWMQKAYPIGLDDVILQKTPYTFDVSVWELFWWSMMGAKVCFLKPGGEKDPGTILAAIEKHRVTTMHFVPSMLSTFLGYIENGADVEKLKSLRQVFASGEALNKEQVIKFNRLLFGKNGTKLINLYGPTEATVDVSYFDCSTGEELETIPIGKPIDNINLYILNTANKLQPIGIPGELHIAGDGLARGYLNRTELTLERFIANPFKPGTKMYKTGDLARWLPDGNIEYLGRIDNQVKVRGFRIELGEIEAELLKHESIKEAVVLARDDKGGDRYLCAYLVAEKELPVAVLRDYLSRNLPDYMIPSYFVRLEKIPLTPNGKVDRKALPAPEGEIVTGRAYEAPTNDVEERLVKIWKDILGIDKIGVNDDFFELGGHSLKAASLAVKIHKEFSVGVTLGELFKAATIKNIGVLIDEAKEKEFIAIERIDVKEYHAVSSSQKRLFIINQLEGDNTTYNLPSMVMIEGSLDIDRFKEVFSKMIRRHESLRTSFKLSGDEPVQSIHDEVEFDIEYQEAPEDKLKEFAKNFIRPFDLGRAPLIRVALVKINPVKLNPTRHLLMFDLHHIIADGVSAVILVKEFAQLYAGAELPELKLQYKDFAAWQNRLNESDEINIKKQYWHDMFSGKVPVLNLPTDFPRPSMQSNEGNKLSFRLDSEMINDLKKLAAEKGATLYMALLAVYNALLYRYTGQEDIVVGSPTAGRQHADAENMIGMFVNTLALRSFPEGGKSFSEFLGEVRDNFLKAYENQDYQFEKLVDSLDLPRDISRNPMFDTMFVLQNMGIPKLELEGLQFLPYSFENKVSKFDLTVEVVDNNDDDTRINIEYCARLFKQSTIERMEGHFENIIREVVKNPALKLRELDMISTTERKQVLKDFNETKADYPKDKTIYQLFEEQVKKTPDQTAVIFEDRQLTYRELNSKVNQLAGVLREKGVNRDSIVGVLLERALEMSIGLMAVLKAGGAYLPISPDYPEERIKYMLQDSGAVLLLTNAGFKDKAVFAGEVLCLEDESLYTGDYSNPKLINTPTDLAYVIYTSGSTGKPKGVTIEHFSLVNRLNWMQQAYPIGEKDVILQKTPYTFDVSVWELFWWSAQGAGVCFLKPGGERDPEAIVEAIEKDRVTTMHFVPSMLSAFLGYLENGVDLKRLASLRQVFASGEALNREQVMKFNRMLFENNGTKLINLYGPTEATVDVSYFDCSTGEELEIIPIGKPIDNINLYILNTANKPQPVGVPGELHIAGDGLARGYLNRPELTTEKFVANPFVQVDTNSGPEQLHPSPFTLHTSRMYKTGDLARWLPDGNIEYLGRIDNQVKVRGFRIELGEVEAELLKHDSIKEVVVAARDDKDGNKFLAAYLVSDAELPVSELREHLAVNLPEYMIPSFFVKVDQIPLTPNGKVDRGALPAPEGDINTGRAYEAPTNEVEESLVNIWKEVLGVDRIGIHDRFFELGGYSILLIKMHNKIEQLYPGRIKITDYFSYPTIAKLAEFIQGGGSGTKDLPIKSVEMPLDYFNVEANTTREVALKLSLESKVEARIFEVAAREEISADGILLAVYAYLFGQICEKEAVTVQAAVGSPEVVYSLDIELANVNKFADLAGLISNRLKEPDAAKTYKVKDVTNTNSFKDRVSVIPMFYKTGVVPDNYDALSHFDIALEFGVEEGKINCMCKYNGRRLNKVKMKEFAGLYLKLLELFLE